MAAIGRPRTSCAGCRSKKLKCRHDSSPPPLARTRVEGWRPLTVDTVRRAINTLRGAGRKHLVIPDCQVKPGVDTRHLTWIGEYIVEKRPDVVVCIGDFADMPSLSSYDRGKTDFGGRRYSEDIEAAVAGMSRLMEPLLAARNLYGYHPRLVMTLGNHEDRITRAVNDDSRLAGTIGLKDLRYEEFGWEVYPFLQVVTIDGIEYAHYFISGQMGRPVSSAQAILRERMSSAIQGHNQKFDMAVHPRTGHIAMMAGACYLHDEKYLTPQGNQNVRRQVVMLHEVRGGKFDVMLVSLDYLKRKYEG